MPIAEAWIGTRRPTPASNRNACADGTWSAISTSLPTRVPRLTDSPVSAASAQQLLVPAVEPEARLGATAEGDQAGAEVVALRASILGHKPGGDQRLEQPVGRAHGESGGRGEGGDAEVVVGCLEDGEHVEGPIDGLRAAAPVALPTLHDTSLLDFRSFHVAEVDSVM